MISTVQSSNYIVVYDIEHTICFVAVLEISLNKNFPDYLNFGNLVSLGRIRRHWI